MTVYTISLTAPQEGAFGLRQPAFTASAIPVTDDDNVIERVELQYGTDPAFATFTQANAVWLPSGAPVLFPIAGLSPATSYYFRARAGDGASNWSSWSGTGEVLTLTAPMQTPASVFASWNTGLAIPPTAPVGANVFPVWNMYAGFAGPPAGVR